MIMEEFRLATGRGASGVTETVVGSGVGATVVVVVVGAY